MSDSGGTAAGKQARRKRAPIYDESSGVPPTEEQVRRMKKQAWNVATYWLNAGEMTRAQLLEKIRRKGITSEVAESLLDDLEERDYLNDQRYVENFIHSKLTYEKLGKRAIAFKLRAKGATSDDIEEALTQVSDETEEDNAALLAQRRAATTASRKQEPQKRIQSIAGYLARRGYNGGIAFRAAREAVEADQGAS